jgi:hypothetical protein
MTAADPVTIAAASSYVRSEVAVRRTGRELRTAIHDLIGVDADDAAGVLAPMCQRTAQSIEERDAVAAQAVEVVAKAEAYRSELAKLEARYDRARARLARKYGRDS